MKMDDKNKRNEELRKAYDESLKELEKYSVEELDASLSEVNEEME
jgi:hypothetical protein